MASVTVTFPDSVASIIPTSIAWAPAFGDLLPLGNALSANSSNIFLNRLILQRASSNIPGHTQIQLSPDQMTGGTGAGPEFTDAMEMNGSITFMASDGMSVTVTGIGDSTEPYAWTPSNASDVASLADHIVGLTDRTLTVTFNDNANPPPVVTIATLALQPSTTQAPPLLTLLLPTPVIPTPSLGPPT